MKLQLNDEQKTREESTKVSMVVAIYKSEKFLDKLINSALNQTHKNLELILVDDGSPDGSAEICDKWAAKDDRVVVIHKENSGACDARNQGLARVTGEYLMITDGDDWMESDYVEYLLSIAIMTQSDMAMSDQIFTTRDRIQSSNDDIEIWTAEEAATNIIYPRIAIGPWNKIYKFSMITDNKLSFNVPWSGEGLYFTSTAAQLSNHVEVGHRKVYDYRLNNTESGLTNYNVQMGLNAKWNIRNIGEKLTIKTPKLQNAVRWHIWKNYNWILLLIIATGTQEQYKDEYKECRIKVRTMLPEVLAKSEFSINCKIKMLIQGLFPVTWAKRDIKKQQNALAKDKMV